MGTPWRHTILELYNSASCGAVLVLLICMKWATLVSRFIITQRESYPDYVLGNPTIKSVAISFHYHSGTCKGCNNPAGRWRSVLTHCCKEQQTWQHLNSFRTTNRLPWDHGTSYFLLDEWNKRTHEPLEISYPWIPYVRHINPSFIPQHSFVILRKTRWLLLLDITLYFCNALFFTKE
jgi:hypothetical protein